MTTEVVVYNIESAVNAQRGGADRVELCDNPAGGGTTPSLGTIAVLRDLLDITLFVMIRPREGDFCYSDHEFEAMKHDIKQALKLGADGVVLGILRPDGTVDEQRNKALINLARPMEVTFHRAFDMTRDPMGAMESCIAAGFDRILTSGQQAKAQQGIPLINKLVKKGKERISIMAGCGVNEESVNKIIRKTGVSEIHIAAETTRPSLMKYRNTQIEGMGFTTGKEYIIDTVSDSRVNAIRRKALSAWND